MNKVTPEVLSEVIKRLVDALNPEQIYLFGSYAWGVPNEHSDIDLLVITEDRTTPELTQARSAFTALRGVDIAKDIIVQTRFDFDRFSAVRSSFSYKIANEGVLIYDRRHDRRNQTGVGSAVALQSQ